jgi:hypothetical protein
MRDPSRAMWRDHEQELGAVAVADRLGVERGFGDMSRLERPFNSV